MFIITKKSFFLNKISLQLEKGTLNLLIKKNLIYVTSFRGKKKMKQRQFRLELAIIIGIFFISMMIGIIGFFRLETTTSVENNEEIDEFEKDLKASYQPHTSYDWPVIYWGTWKSDYVRVLHLMLRGWGYTIDSYDYNEKRYGPCTVRAVASFKMAVGLTSTYKYDYGRYVYGSTWRCLFKNVVQGSGRINHIKALQTLLIKKFGYTWDICIDGSFGPITKENVKKFQDNHIYWNSKENAYKWLVEDGRVGPNTWQSLLISPVETYGWSGDYWKDGSCYEGTLM